MRTKIVCKHSPRACWVSNFSNSFEEIKLYAYPMAGTFEIPIIYHLAVVIVIPKEKVPKDLEKFKQTFRDFAEGWPLKVTIDDAGENKQPDGELQLFYFIKALAREMLLTDSEKTKAYSLLNALFNQDSAPKSLRWICAEGGLERTYPVFPDVSSWKKNIDNIKNIMLDSMPVYTIIFPQNDIDYSVDYSVQFTAENDPLGKNLQLVPFPLERLDSDTIKILLEKIRSSPAPGFAKRYGLFNKLKKVDVKFLLEILKTLSELAKRIKP